MNEEVISNMELAIELFQTVLKNHEQSSEELKEVMGGSLLEVYQDAFEELHTILIKINDGLETQKEVELQKLGNAGL